MNGITQVRPSELAQQNDLFRQRFASVCLWRGELLLGRVVATAGVAALRLDRVEEAIAKIQAFSAFDEEDPHEEHDFGAVEVGPTERPTRVVWKLDLYDETFSCASPNPTDPRRTRRVLTLMLASDY